MEWITAQTHTSMMAALACNILSLICCRILCFLVSGPLYFCRLLFFLCCFLGFTSSEGKTEMPKWGNAISRVTSPTTTTAPLRVKGKRMNAIKGQTTHERNRC